jgi:hypothetical protein
MSRRGLVTIPPMAPSSPDFIEGPAPADVIGGIVEKTRAEHRFLTDVEFGDCLRALRKLSGQTLGDLADRLDTSAAALSGVELGKRL